MIYQEEQLRRALTACRGASLRINEGGLEVLHESGLWKSLGSHYNAPFFTQLFLEANCSDDGAYLLYGIGDGQILESLLTTESTATYYVIETNMDVIAYAETTFSMLDRLREEPRISFCGTTDLTEVRAFLKIVPDGAHVRYFYPSLDAIPKELSAIRDWFNNRMIDLNSERKFGQYIALNLAHNLTLGLPDVLQSLKGKLHGPALVVVSGPTVVDSMSFIQSVAHKVLILSIGRNGKLFKEAGFSPDLWVDMDPQHRPEIWERVRFNDEAVPYAILDSASLLIHNYFQGSIGLVRSQVDGTEEFAVPTGKSTVAALALELAIMMGCGPVTLVGQDLCYIGDKSHAGDSHAVAIDRSMPKVRCNDGEERYSSKEFIRHRESMEKVIRSHDCEVHTLSKKGIQIEGATYWSEEELRQSVESLSFDKDAVIRRIREAFHVHDH